jgi:ABC-type branched-subunit amino acid transport system permease subunit
MSVGWSYFWPLVGAGLLIGLLGGLIAFRRRKQLLPLAVAAFAAIAAAGAWHGPLGGAESFRAEVDRTAKLTLENYEMTTVDARLQQSPLTRTLALNGRADPFQRGELVRILSTLPGVASATWSGARGWPLLLEGALVALGGYLAGLLIAYLVELRRRHNAEWKW